MCGRYRLSRRKQVVEELLRHCRFRGRRLGSALQHRPHPADPSHSPESEGTSPELSLMRWGLIPSWAKDSSGAASMINARSETASTKPAFRDALKSRRCLIPADGFYEWKRDGQNKQPFCFEVNDGQLFAFAGLWERWKNPSGDWVKTCSILTTTPNDVTAAVHDRMPVFLDPDAYDVWLDPGMTSVAAASELLKPCDARQMRCFPVSIRVNSTMNDDEECSKPVELAQIQNGLFS